jgi:hypothetical protein
MTARPRPPWDIKQKRQKTIAEADAVTRKPGTPFHQRNMHGKVVAIKSVRIRRRTEITTIWGISFLLSVEGFMVVERFAAVANVRGSGETWRRSRKLPCRTNADGRLSSCQ